MYLCYQKAILRKQEKKGSHGSVSNIGKSLRAPKKS